MTEATSFVNGLSYLFYKGIPDEGYPLSKEGCNSCVLKYENGNFCNMSSRCGSGNSSRTNGGNCFSIDVYRNSYHMLGWRLLEIGMEITGRPMVVGEL